MASVVFDWLWPDAPPSERPTPPHPHRPTTNAAATHPKAPSNYVSHLLGHEGDGSAFALLKARGWASALAAGESGSSISSRALFYVRVELTGAPARAAPLLALALCLCCCLVGGYVFACVVLFAFGRRGGGEGGAGNGARRNGRAAPCAFRAPHFTPPPRPSARTTKRPPPHSTNRRRPRARRRRRRRRVSVPATAARPRRRHPRGMCVWTRARACHACDCACSVCVCVSVDCTALPPSS